MRTCGQSFGASTNASALMNWKRSGSFLAMLLHFIVIGWPGHMRFSIRWARKSSGTNWGRMLTHLKTITTPSNIRWQGNTCSVSTTGWQMVLCLRRAVLLEMCIRWRLEKLLPLARENIWGNRWRFEQGYQGVIIDSLISGGIRLHKEVYIHSMTTKTEWPCWLFFIPIAYHPAFPPWNKE